MELNHLHLDLESSALPDELLALIKGAEIIAVELYHVNINLDTNLLYLYSI